MVLFQDLVANRGPLENFRASISRNGFERSDKSNPQLSLHVFEWSKGGQHGSESNGMRSIEDLQSQDQAIVRVIFAPRDVPAAANGEGLCQLFERCDIPSGFIEESLDGVSQSFAARKHVDGTTYVWFHFLCKDIATRDGRVVQYVGPHDAQQEQLKDPAQAQALSQANFTWIKPGFVLKIAGKNSSPPVPSRSTTSSSGSTLTTVSKQPKVELFCFGAPIGVCNRFQILKDAVSCEDLIKDPYVMLEVVMNELYKVMDRTGWLISDVFGEIERQTLELACTPGKAAYIPGKATKKKLDFAGLHNLCKHCIYLRENCESALATLSDLRDHHKSVLGDKPNPLQESTRQALKYQKTLFQSTQRRLTSLDARMANMIQLSFHIVTQGDSRLMQSENQSMKTIAVMTLIFMPLSTVATIFGTQFMKLHEEEPYHLTVSPDFWLLWVIAVPLTIIVMTCWRVWYADAKGRLIDEISPEAKRGMGWKTLRQTMRWGGNEDAAVDAVVIHRATPDAKV